LLSFFVNYSTSPITQINNRHPRSGHYHKPMIHRNIDIILEKSASFTLFYVFHQKLAQVDKIVKPEPWCS